MVNNLDDIVREVHDLKEHIQLIPELYKQNLEKAKQIRELDAMIKELSEKLARHDCNKIKIETTAEGKSVLKSRYNFWYKLIKAVIGK